IYHQVNEKPENHQHRNIHQGGAHRGYMSAPASLGRVIEVQDRLGESVRLSCTVHGATSSTGGCGGVVRFYARSQCPPASGSLEVILAKSRRFAPGQLPDRTPERRKGPAELIRKIPNDLSFLTA